MLYGEACWPVFLPYLCVSSVGFGYRVVCAAGRVVLLLVWED